MAILTGEIMDLGMGKSRDLASAIQNARLSGIRLHSEHPKFIQIVPVSNLVFSEGRSLSE
jgi:hypothetical protein